jgi:glycosyltransferase involved in cell wall biosynthesis
MQKYTKNNSSVDIVSEYNKASGYSELPLVTVITVVFNAVDSIEQTINGVLGQTYENIEYIVIDGKSNDGTLEIIKKYSDKITRWISEEDKGVYDAMNKGVAMATGEWINFMNAGDVFCDKNTVESLFEGISEDTDLVYGNAIEKLVSGGAKNLEAGENLENLWKGALFGHESLFVKSNIIKNNLFNLKYKVAADYDFIMKCFYKGYKFEKVGVDVLLFSLPGFSREHWVVASLENWKIARKYEKQKKVSMYYLSNFLFGLIVRAIKYLLPEKFYLKLHKFYKKVKGLIFKN